MWTPVSDLSTNLGVIIGLTAGSSISSYLLSVRAIATFSSFMAKLWPMQFLCMNGTKSSNRIRMNKSQHYWKWCLKLTFYMNLVRKHLYVHLIRFIWWVTNLGPAEKGKNAYTDLLETLSGRKRSGSKTCTNARQTHKPQCNDLMCKSLSR